MENPGHILGSAFLFFLGAGAVIGTVHLQVGTPTEPQPGFFPFAAGIVLLAFSAIIFLRGGYPGGTQRQVTFGEVGRPAVRLGVMTLPVLALDRLGSVIGVFVVSGSCASWA